MDGLDVATHQRETGVKDVMAGRIIQGAQKERERLSTDAPSMTEDEKRAHMADWIRKQGQILNPFFTVAGTPNAMLSRLILTFLQLIRLESSPGYSN